MKKISLLIIFISLTTTSGCALLTNKREINTLQNYSKSGEDLDDYVEMRDAQFASLLELAQNNTVNQYLDAASIVKQFGPPILKKSVARDGKSLTRFLYRKQTEKFKAQKVYLYFDQDNKLVSWEVTKP